MSRSPSGPSRINGGVPVGFRSSPQRVEEKNWSHFAPRGLEGSLAEANHPTRSECRSLRAIPPPDDLGTTQAGRNRIDHSHAGFPQGLLTRRFSSYLVSYWLTNAIDRIVKETPVDGPGDCARDTSTISHDLPGRCFTLTHRHHRPVQCCILAACAGRRLTLDISEAKTILTRKFPRSTPPRGIF